MNFMPVNIPNIRKKEKKRNTALKYTNVLLSFLFIIYFQILVLKHRGTLIYFDFSHDVKLWLNWIWC